MPELTKNQEIAGEILNQLGGRSRLVAMTGASNFLAIDNGLSFKLPKASGNPYNYVKIVLTPMDEYDVTFMQIRGLEIKKQTTFEHLQFDNLRPIIERATGLYLSL